MGPWNNMAIQYFFPIWQPTYLSGMWLNQQHPKHGETLRTKMKTCFALTWQPINAQHVNPIIILQHGNPPLLKISDRTYFLPTWQLMHFLILKKKKYKQIKTLDSGETIWLLWLCTSPWKKTRQISAKLACLWFSAKIRVKPAWSVFSTQEQKTD